MKTVFLDVPVPTARAWRYAPEIHFSADLVEILTVVVVSILSLRIADSDSIGELSDEEAEIMDDFRTSITSKIAYLIRFLP